MKRFIFIIMALTAALLLAPQAAAVDTKAEISDRLGINELSEALPEDAAELIGETGALPGENFGGALRRLFSGCILIAAEALKKTGRSAGLMLVCAAACAAASSLYKPRGTDYVELAGTLAVAIIAAGDVNSCLSLGTRTITGLSDFSKVLLPVMTGAAAMSGSVSAGTAKYAATALFMDVLITLSQKVLTPLIYAYFAALIAECTIGGKSLSGVTSFLKWLAVTLLTVLVLAFTLYLGLTGVVSGSADAAAVRVAKTAFSTTLPVVGGIISDAAASVLSGAALVKNTAGAFGLIAVLAICAAPVINIGAHYIIYKTAARLSLSLAGNKTVKAAEGAGTAFGIMLGCSGACAVMMFFSVISYMGAVR